MSDLTNTDLLNLLHEAAGQLSYYNAAEGDTWRREAIGRANAQKHWNYLVNQAIERGIYNPEEFKKGYLV